MKTLALILTVLFIPTMVIANDPGTANEVSEKAVIRLSEPVSITDTHEVFGAPMPLSERTLSLEELIKNSEQHLGNEVVVSTQIVEVCQKKGCFFIARDGEAAARITFRDYAFFIPTDSAGKVVTLAGSLSRETLTLKQSEHLASDLGQPVASVDSLQYTIVASSVRIPKGRISAGH